MPYDKVLDARLAEHMAVWGTTRKKMFGGTCYLMNGNMVCGVYEDLLILRLGIAGAEAALKQPLMTPFDITGKPMKGWVMVNQEGLAGDKLDAWMGKARSFVETLPTK